MAEDVDVRLLKEQKRAAKDQIRQMTGDVVDTSPFTVKVRGSERTGLVYLSGYSPAIGDRVLLTQRGNEPPVVHGRLSDEGSPVPAWQTFGAFEMFSHSATQGGASTSHAGTDERLSALLGADCVRRMRGGARLSWMELSSQEVGGWAHIYRYIAPPATGGSETNKYMISNRDLVVLWFGNNDLAQLGPPGADLEPFTVSLEACISRARAAMILEENNATVTFPTGSWTRYGAGVVERGGSNLLYASGGYYQAAISGSVRVVTPSDFQGGTIALAFIVATDGSGAAMNFTVNGVAAGSLDTRNKNAHDYGTSPSSGTNLNPNTVIKRFTDLPPGANTIVATMTAGTLFAFDCWWIEAAIPPLVVVVGGWETDDSVPLFDFYDLAGFPYVPVAGDIAGMDAAMQAVVDTFDDDVMLVEINSHLNRDRKYFSPDHIHLSDRGHAIVAEQIAQAVQRHPRTRTAHAEGSGDSNFATLSPNTTDRNVIEAGQAEATPLTLMGRRPGDQFASLLRLDGAGSYALSEFAIDIEDTTDARIGVVDDDDLVITGAEAGDLVVRADTNRVLISSADTTPLTVDGSEARMEDGTHKSRMGIIGTIPYFALDEDVTIIRTGSGLAVVTAASKIIHQHGSTAAVAEQIETGTFGGLAYILIGGDIMLMRTAANALLVAAGDHISTDDPTAAQHVATKAYVDAYGGIWRLVSESPVNLAGDNISSNYWAFDQSGAMASAGVDGFNSNAKPWFFYFNASDYPTVSGKTAKMRIVASVLSNANADPNVNLDFQMWAISSAGGADAITWDIDTAAQIGNTAQITNTNLGTSDKEMVASTVFNLPSSGWYTLTMKPSATLAANSVIWAKARVEVHYE